MRPNGCNLLTTTASVFRKPTFPFYSKEDFAGIASNRSLRPYKVFEAELDRVLGPRVKADGAYAVDLWSALTNTSWSGPDGLTVTYGFRRASEAVAWVREDEDSVLWYCSGPPAVVAPWIEEAMAEVGWRWSIED
jgi:hypothetical protein